MIVINHPLPAFEFLMNQVVEVEMSDTLCKYIYIARKGILDPQRMSYYRVDWESEDGVRIYLGTYWPKTFSESFVFFYSYFSRIDRENFSKTNKKLRILDLGSNSLPATAGFLEAFRRFFGRKDIPIEIVAVDKNNRALEEGKTFIKTFFSELKIVIKVINEKIENVKLKNNKRFDVVLASKVGCEMFEEGNFESYKKILNLVEGVMRKKGLFYLAEITRKPTTNSEWFFPQLINRQIKNYVLTNGSLLPVFPFPCGFYARGCENDNCFIQAQLNIAIPIKDEKITAKVFYKLFMFKEYANKFLRKFGDINTPYPVKFLKGKSNFCIYQRVEDMKVCLEV